MLPSRTKILRPLSESYFSIKIINLISLDQGKNADNFDF